MAPDPRLVVDYEKLIGRLTERACRVLGVVRAVASTHVVDGLGKSPEDFALDVVTLYVTDKLQFSGDEKVLFPFLAKVMGRDILDELRSSARKTTVKVPALAAEGTKCRPAALKTVTAVSAWTVWWKATS